MSANFNIGIVDNYLFLKSNKFHKILFILFRTRFYPTQFNKIRSLYFWHTRKTTLNKLNFSPILSSTSFATTRSIFLNKLAFLYNLVVMWSGCDLNICASFFLYCNKTDKYKGLANENRKKRSLVFFVQWGLNQKHVLCNWNSIPKYFF